jgi:seryl-tRNA synthetase
MLDIKRIVEQKEEVQKGLLKRMNPEDINLDEIISLYEDRKKLQTEFDSARAEQNSFNEKMSKIDKKGDEFKKLLEELKKKSEEVKGIEEKLRNTETELKSKVEVLPNVPDEDVVAGGKEKNEVVKEVGKKPEFSFAIRDHVELGTDLDIFDFERASKISGNNFSMYKGLGAQLEWALINYFISEHLKAGYEMIIPPNLVVRESAYAAGQLPKFEDDVYWVQDGLCLIPTAETVLTNMYRDEVLDEKDLPKKFFAYTPCYRREAGSYRANEKGLIRMHQFNKIEMYQFVKPEDANQAMNELLDRAEELVAGLGMHYRVVKLAAGDCSAGMAKTYDVEVYIPSIDKYYEVSSLSNARDYQARRGNMRYKREDGKLEYLNTLNASGLATSRLMVGLIETYQNEDGSIDIPEVLRPYMGGVDKIVK